MCGEELNPSYELLGNAIVRQAVIDYKRAKRRLAEDPSNEKAQLLLQYTMNFFYSEWFKTLTNVDPQFLLDYLDKEPNAPVSPNNGKCRGAI